MKNIPSTSWTIIWKASTTKASLDLPTDIESVAALEHLGLIRKVAGDVFERYAKRPNPQQNADGILEYAFGELNRLKAQLSLQDIPPRQVMNTLGISNELQNTLLNPRFTQLFESQTLLYWLKDSMRMRFKTLEQMCEESRQTPMYRKIWSKKILNETIYTF